MLQFCDNKDYYNCLLGDGTNDITTKSTFCTFKVLHKPN